MNTAQIEQSVRRLYEAQQEKKKFDQYYDEVRKKRTACSYKFYVYKSSKRRRNF